jgi:hypothetical protein
MRISHRPWGWRSPDEFPGCKAIARWMTGDAFSADRGDKFYIILDETILASVVPVDDPTRDELLTVLEFDTFPARERYARRFKVYEKFSPRP